MMSRVQCQVSDREQEALSLDLVDIAGAACVAADAVYGRSTAERRASSVEVVVRVREADFWSHLSEDLTHLLHLMTRHHFRFVFVPKPSDAVERKTGLPEGGQADGICLVSGGIDSLAMAVKLLREGRHPWFLVHHVGNPQMTRAQEDVCRLLSTNWPKASGWSVVNTPGVQHAEALRGTRPLLFMAVGLAAALNMNATKVYFADADILAVAGPLTTARIGVYHSSGAHPKALAKFNELIARIGWNVRVVNPFTYVTKEELIRSFLVPVFTAEELQQTVSCTVAAWRCPHCGQTLPCLLRRIAMLDSGLVEKNGYAVDVLGDPSAFMGTAAYRSMVDLLSWAMNVLYMDDIRLIVEYPHLVDMAIGARPLAEAIQILRTEANTIYRVVNQHFPAAARLMAD